MKMSEEELLDKLGSFEFASEFLIDKKIDRNSLHIENQELPDIFSRWAFRAARAQRDVVLARQEFDNLCNTKKRASDILKKEIEEKKAELNLKIRKDPSSFGIEKITESVVESAILIDEEFKVLYSASIEARYWQNDPDILSAQEALSKKEFNFAVLDAAKDSIITKKSSLKYLSDLFNAGYWSREGESDDGIDRVHVQQREALKS